MGEPIGEPTGDDGIERLKQPSGFTKDTGTVCWPPPATAAAVAPAPKPVKNFPCFCSDALAAICAAFAARDLSIPLSSKSRKSLVAAPVSAMSGSQGHRTVARLVADALLQASVRSSSRRCRTSDKSARQSARRLSVLRCAWRRASASSEQPWYKLNALATPASMASSLAVSSERLPRKARASLLHCASRRSSLRTLASAALRSSSASRSGCEVASISVKQRRSWPLSRPAFAITSKRDSSSEATWRATFRAESLLPFASMRLVRSRSSNSSLRLTGVNRCAGPVDGGTNS
mmetsp:Transcript_18717/g.51405  ORF Transcript_18717/g.51405 Transcript_18717/m.51405 type:complete len:291 (-) Transcript_18717:502-1374(-)